MKTLRLKLKRLLSDGESEATFGVVSGLAQPFATCERIWNNNLPGRSAVPPGFYVLEPHTGIKYADTFALIGETVAHYNNSPPDVSRYACVIHWEDDGRFLQGCISIGETFEWRANGRSKLLGNRINEFLEALRGFDKVYLTIE